LGWPSAPPLVVARRPPYFSIFLEKKNMMGFKKY